MGFKDLLPYVDTENLYCIKNLQDFEKLAEAAFHLRLLQTVMYLQRYYKKSL